MYIHRFRHRATLGARYLTEYLMDRVADPYDRGYFLPRPLDVICEVTYICNLACPTCFRWTAKPDEHELTAAEWKAALVELKRWLGTFNLTFTGGEPFLRADLLEILEFASRLGLVTTVVSNGSLIDATLARKIVASGLDGLVFSLNSLSPDVHNKTRGTRTSFEEVMRAIEHMRASEGPRGRDGMRLSLSTTIVRENIRELVAMVEWTKSAGLYGIHFQPIMPATTLPIFTKDGEAKKVPAGTPYRDLFKRQDLVTDEEIDAIFARLIAMVEEGYPLLNSPEHLRQIAVYLKDPASPKILERVCQTGVKNFNIDPFGNVRLCSIMEIVGNIKEEAPETIWRSANAAAQRHTIRACEKSCRLLYCNFKDLDFMHRVRRVVGTLTG